MFIRNKFIYKLHTHSRIFAEQKKINISKILTYLNFFYAVNKPKYQVNVKIMKF